MTHNPLVAGSSPSRPTNEYNGLRAIVARFSLVPSTMCPRRTRGGLHRRHAKGLLPDRLRHGGCQGSLLQVALENEAVAALRKAGSEKIKALTDMPPYVAQAVASLVSMQIAFGAVPRVKDLQDVGRVLAGSQPALLKAQHQGVVKIPCPAMASPPWFVGDSVCCDEYMACIGQRQLQAVIPALEVGEP